MVKEFLAMRLGVICRHLLARLAARALRGLRPQPSRAAPAPPPVSSPEPPRCACPRPRSYSAYGGDAPTVAYTLTYACPRCGKAVVEHGWRMAEACYPLAAPGGSKRAIEELHRRAGAS